MNRRTGALALVLSTGLLALSGSAGAATASGYATFGAFTGGGGAYSTTMQLPGAGYPAATVTSDSRAGSVGPQTGSTAWLPPTSPPGLRFGSSQGLPYLNLRPAADDATHPSTTTYTFATASPTGWGFVLGDIDADTVAVSATLADGSAAPLSALGFQGLFNYCDASPKPAACAGVVAPFDTPTWNAATGTLTGSGTDTVGGSGWFVPTAALKTLTFRFTRIAGFPVYQTWFAARAQDVTGAVTGTGSCDVTATTVRLLDATGAVLASAHPLADGTYSFAKVAATDTFSVALADVPAGCSAEAPSSRAIDLRTADAVADFAIRAVPVAPPSTITATGTATGTVTDRAGDPVEGARVEIDGPSGRIAADRTGPAGHFDVPGLPAGSLTATVHPPAGFEAVGAATKPVTVPATGGPVPVDFIVRRTATTSASGSSATNAVATSSSTGPLPEVGGPPVGLLALGLGLLVIGAGTTSGARRRH